ncbi:protein SCO1/2 [Nitrosovibrio tenuis]|uniref:Protein SCO1/2 n=2 Tax=Nitrosovibrio tenuis TaxID=1233 RepID=A0A1H7RGE8_9PROT|nr:protein SCO1/2 [Nitrosovibrio tenuis]
MLALAACGNTAKPTFLSTDITGATFGKELKLVGHDGVTRTLADFKGKAIVLFFGYTHCPDVCPATMGEIASAVQKLGKDAARVQVLFVTIDPERDTPETLKQYLSAFDPAFLGLHGDAGATKIIADEFKIVYQKHAGNSSDHDTMDHSAGVYIFDTKGQLRLYASGNGNSADILARDIGELLRTTG